MRRRPSVAECANGFFGVNRRALLVSAGTVRLRGPHRTRQNQRDSAIVPRGRRMFGPGGQPERSGEADPSLVESIFGAAARVGLRPLDAPGMVCSHGKHGGSGGPRPYPAHRQLAGLVFAGRAWFLRGVKIWSPHEWIARREAHSARVEPWVKPRLERMSRGERHAVEDFLFEYYPHRPSQLRRWHPGAGVVLLGDEAREYLAISGYVEMGDGVGVGPLAEKRRGFVEWLHGFLEGIDGRAPAFGCHGLHEWAMVYRADEVRHGNLRLRLEPKHIAELVESLPVRCSHYDAFRFFTPEARPLNRLQPTRETTPLMEQPGCLHANMDLYKWAFKLSPWTPSELVADAFELARDIRELDMRASPYDLAELGYEAVRIETPEGRLEYERAQRGFAERARPIRKRLVDLCGAVLGD